jgi:DNA polymerase III epsilon subunit-like protein
MSSDNRREVYISVDVESAGPYPGQYSLLSIGACTLDEPPSTFYVELQPVNRNSTSGAQAIHQLDLEHLAQIGRRPADAMRAFNDWLAQVAPANRSRPVFVAFNAAFDWMFVNEYFQRYLGRNPFGHTALDIKAFFMGLHGVRWSETGLEQVAAHYKCDWELIHHALDDALNQALLFKRMLDEARRRPTHLPGTATKAM